MVALLAGCGAEWHQISATQTAQAGGATDTPTPPPVATARLVLAGPATPTVGAAGLSAPLTPTPDVLASPTPVGAIENVPPPTEPPAPTWTPTTQALPTRAPAPTAFIAVTPGPGESSTPGLAARVPERQSAPPARTQRAAIPTPPPPPAATVAGRAGPPAGQPVTQVPFVPTIVPRAPTPGPAPAPSPTWTPPPLLAAPVARPATPSELLALGANRTLRLATFHYRVDASAAPLDLGYGLRATAIEGDAQEPGRSTLAVSGSLDGRPTSATFLDLEGRYYRRDPLGVRWQSLQSPLPIDIFAAQQSLAAGMNVARTPQQVADEPVEGTPCHHVIASIQAVSLTSLFGTPVEGPPVRADYWIANADLTVRQITLTGKITYDATSASQVVRITLSRLGATVSLPSP